MVTFLSYDSVSPHVIMDAAWKKVKKYGYYDLKRSVFGVEKVICNEENPCLVRVSLYASMGLHRFNLLQGTKYKLRGVEKYVFTTLSPAGSSYYITLDAMDPSDGLQTFQISVSEYRFGQLMLMCDIAGIRGEHIVTLATSMVRNLRLPEFPPENPFDMYHMINDSELQENEDWIRLYLELSIATTDRWRENSEFGISKLEIVKVAIDANNDEEGLNAKTATFYIQYKDLYMAGLGQDGFDRIAMVRRSFHEEGCFILVGQNQSLDSIIPQNQNAGESSVNGLTI